MDLDNFARVRLAQFYDWVSSKMPCVLENFGDVSIVNINCRMLPVFKRDIVEHHRFVTKYSTIPDIDALELLDSTLPSSVVDAYAMLAVYAEFSPTTVVKAKALHEELDVLMPKSVEMPVGIIEKFKEAI